MTAEILNEKAFRERMSQLLMEHKMSEREMSLALGNNPTYINQVVTGKTNIPLPEFFEFCRILGVTPAQFFGECNRSEKEKNILTELGQLNQEQLLVILSVIRLIEN